jgi:phospholipid/cholesterol/gamma-HCH transport system ATP-binding protein
VIVSHDVAETANIADYIYLLSNGQIVAEGTPEQMKSVQNPRVTQFMQGLPDGPVPFHFPAIAYADDVIGATT